MAAPQPIEHPKPKAESRKPPAKKFEWHAATIKRSIPLGRMEGRKEGGRGTRSSLSKQPIHSKRTRSARRTEQRTSVEEREVCPEAPIASVRSFALCNRLAAGSCPRRPRRRSLFCSPIGQGPSKASSTRLGERGCRASEVRPGRHSQLEGFAVRFGGGR